MRKQVSQRDRGWISGSNRQLVEQGCERFVERQLATLDQLQRGGRGEQLRNGSDPKRRLGGVNRLLSANVCEAVSLRKLHPPVGDNDDDRTGHA
jgi:hypothetical protein